jgi:hypothetical protein
LVAVTTATEVGVATPSTGAGAGDGEGVPPEGGGAKLPADELPPPPQADRALEAASRDRMRTPRAPRGKM